MTKQIKQIKQIVVFRPSAIGDFVFALPCLSALKATYPDAHLTYIGKSWHADFLAHRPGLVDEVLVLPPCEGINAAQSDSAALPAFLKQLQERRIDIALQMYGGGRYANPLIKHIGARFTAGLCAADADATLLDASVFYGRLQNRRLQLLELAALAGAKHLPLGPPGTPELCVTDQDRQAAARVVPPDLQTLLLIQPGASDPRRRWAPARFAATADAIADAMGDSVTNAVAATDLRIAVIGTSDEAALVAKVIAGMHAPAINLSVQLSLSALCGLLERCVLLISNDTGPLHLATAIGTPAVGIYWRDNLIESQPLQQHLHRAAWTVQSTCPVCGEENLTTRCEHQASFVGGIGVEEVVTLATELLQTTHALPVRRQ